MKKYRLIFLAVALSLTFLICPFGWAEPIVLKSLAITPPPASLSKTFDAYLDEVEKRTNGEVKFERYYSSALAKPPEMLDACGIGIFDIFTSVAGYYPGKMPLALVFSIPGSYEHAWVASMALLDLYKTVPAMEKELEKNNVKYVAAWTTGPFYLLTKKKVQSLEELRGLKIRATALSANLAKALGAVPVAMDYTEAQTALSRGVIDGGIFSPDAVMSFGLNEAAKFIWKVNVGGGTNPILINLDKWKSLPGDIQKIMLEAGEDFSVINEELYQIKGDNAALEKMKQAGLTITEPTAELQEQIRKIAKEEIWYQQAKKLDARGLPGTQVLEAYIELLEKYKPQCPFN